MGWASGSQLAEDLWDDIRKLIPAKDRAKAAKIVVEHFEFHDCDTLEECTKLMKDTKYPKCNDCGGVIFATGETICAFCDQGEENE